MKQEITITDIESGKNYWIGRTDPSKVYKKRCPWKGLTPEEAYRKGQEDERSDALRRKIEKIPKICKR